MRLATVFLSLLLLGGGRSVARPPTGETETETETDIRARDQAFGLLLVLLADVQGELIEVNHEQRLQQAAAQPTAGDAARVVPLAGMEREGREQHLNSQLARLQLLYHLMRQRDEAAVGQPVASRVDLLTAKRQLATQFTMTDIMPLPASTTPAAVTVGDSAAHLALLRQTLGDQPSLADSVRDAHQPATMPLLLQYRLRDGKPCEVHTLSLPLPGADLLPWNAGAGAADTKWPAVGTWALTALPHLAPPGATAPLPHLLRAMLAGQWSDARALTTEPLHLVLLLPEPGALLPRSLASRCRGLALTLTLAEREWNAELRLMAGSDRDAQSLAELLNGASELVIGSTVLEPFRAQLHDHPARAETNQARLALRLPAAEAWRLAERGLGRLQALAP